MNEKRNNERAKGAYRPKLTFFHANGKGTGCAVTMELHPAHDAVDGSIFVSAANQMTVGDRNGPNPTYPRFDWENKITVRLCFPDLCRILQVLRGECESLEDGKGLIHRRSDCMTRIVFRHLVEPVQGYSFEIYRSYCDKREDRQARIFFSMAEAMGLVESIAGSMAVISFGIPKVIERSNQNAIEESREESDAFSAA